MVVWIPSSPGDELEVPHFRTFLMVPGAIADRSNSITLAQLEGIPWLTHSGHVW